MSELLRSKANYIRNLVLEMCSAASTGHVTSSFSCTEILVALYYGGILRFDPQKPKWEGRDRLIISKAQASAILYPVLADLGFFPKEELGRFCQADGKFGVHLQNDVPGVEITSGSLGHGFGVATGLALAAKMNRQLHLVFALLGDGECCEGSIWEAAMFASHKRLSNLIAIIDRNYLMATDFTENAIELEPLEEKWRAFGWRVKSIDGHSFEEIFDALDGVRSRRSSKPLVIIARTVKGKGVDFMSDDPLWHAVAPKGDEITRAKNQLGVDEPKPFREALL
ncbi:MAG: transketolase [Dehalococcoidales bacterium]|nr:transketolase [Dehalococcoidales bacterium]